MCKNMKHNYISLEGRNCKARGVLMYLLGSFHIIICRNTEMNKCMRLECRNVGRLSREHLSYCITTRTTFNETSLCELERITLWLMIRILLH